MGYSRTDLVHAHCGSVIQQNRSGRCSRLGLRWAIPWLICSLHNNHGGLSQCQHRSGRCSPLRMWAILSKILTIAVFHSLLQPVV